MWAHMAQMVASDWSRADGFWLVEWCHVLYGHDVMRDRRSRGWRKWRHGATGSDVMRDRKSRGLEWETADRWKKGWRAQTREETPCWKKGFFNVLGVDPPLQEKCKVQSRNRVVAWDKIHVMAKERSPKSYRWPRRSWYYQWTHIPNSIASEPVKKVMANPFQGNSHGSKDRFHCFIPIPICLHFSSISFLWVFLVLFHFLFMRVPFPFHCQSSHFCYRLFHFICYEFHFIFMGVHFLLMSVPFPFYESSFLWVFHFLLMSVPFYECSISFLWVFLLMRVPFHFHKVSWVPE